MNATFDWCQFIKIILKQLGEMSISDCGYFFGIEFLALRCPFRKTKKKKQKQKQKEKQTTTTTTKNKNKVCP